MEKPIRSLLLELIREGMSSETATDLVLSSLDAEALKSLARGPVLYMAGRLARDEARKTEDAAFQPGKGYRMSEGALREIQRGRPDLSRAVFHLQDGTVIEWAAASVDEHRARALFQRLKAKAIDEDAHRHEVAAAMIEECGVISLGDIPNWQERLRERLTGEGAVGDEREVAG